MEFFRALGDIPVYIKGILGLTWYGYLATSFLAEYVRGSWRADIELCAPVTSEEPRKFGYRFRSCLPFLDPSKKLVGPLDRLRIMCPLDELTGDARDVSGGGINHLSNGATTIMEVRGISIKRQPCRPEYSM